MQVAMALGHVVNLVRCAAVVGFGGWLGYFYFTAEDFGAVGSLY
jgi:hypothetical protein